MFGFLTSIFTKKELQEKLNEVHSKSVQRLCNSDEYLNNKMQIDCIKNVLIKHTDTPEKLVNWLIDAVQKNVTLEYEITNKEMIDYVNLKLALLQLTKV